MDIEEAKTMQYNIRNGIYNRVGSIQVLDELIKDKEELKAKDKEIENVKKENASCLRIITDQTKENTKLKERVKELEELNVSESCNYYVAGNDTAMNCNNCGLPKHQHKYS